MSYSTCCGAETNKTEIGICPECLEHCDWEEENESDYEDEKEEDNNWLWQAQARRDKAIKEGTMNEQ